MLNENVTVICAFFGSSRGRKSLEGRSRADVGPSGDVNVPLGFQSIDVALACEHPLFDSEYLILGPVQ